MPGISQSRAHFERKITETVDWLTANNRKVIIIGSTVLAGPLGLLRPAGCFQFSGLSKAQRRVRSRGPS